MSSTPPARKGRLSATRFLVISIVAHLIFGAAATYFIVSRIEAKRKITFQNGAPVVNPSQRALEHKVSMAQKKKSGGAPPQAKRIVSTGIAKVSLPDLPVIQGATNVVPGMMSGLGGAGFGQGTGFGNGMGSGLGGAGFGGGFSFFGLQARAHSVLFVLDSSMSNVNGATKSPKTYRELEKEVSKVVKGLPPQTQFNLVLYAPRLWTFNEQMVAAEAPTKDAALEFMTTNSVATARETSEQAFRQHSGTRMDLAIEKAFQLKPEVIFWVSDGMPTHPPGFKGDQNELMSFLLGKLAEAQKNHSPKIKINTIAYKMDTKKSGQDEARQFMVDIAKQNDGKFKEIR